MSYKSLLPLSHALLLATTPAQPFGNGLIFGIAGLTAGMMMTASARHHRYHRGCGHRHHRGYVVEEPVYIESIPVMRSQAVMDRPIIVKSQPAQQPPMQEHVIDIPAVVTTHAPAEVELPLQDASSNLVRERELALEEKHVHLELLKEENRKRELALEEIALAAQKAEKKARQAEKEAAQRALQAQKAQMEAAKKKAQPAQPAKKDALEERKIALKELQATLELLKEENRSRALKKPASSKPQTPVQTSYRTVPVKSAKLDAEKRARQLQRKQAKKQAKKYAKRFSTELRKELAKRA